MKLLVPDWNSATAGCFNWTARNTGSCVFLNNDVFDYKFVNQSFNI
ncbi:hypothetical protein [Aequorivita antarctica]|nr:hypothetical protein [Aequorivita antarctica]